MALVTPVAETTVNGPTAVRRGSPPPRPAQSMYLLMLTPRQARAILQDDLYPGQRPLRSWHVAYQRSLLEAGDLRPGTEIAFCTIGKGTKARRYLINGQHTLAALGQTKQPGFWFWVQEIVCTDMTEVAAYYKTFDRNLPRTWAELLKGDPDMGASTLGLKGVAMLNGALTLIATGFVPQTSYWDTMPAHALTRNARIRKALHQDWQPEMQAFLATTIFPHTYHTRKLLERAGVLSVALVTYRYQSARAAQFWSRVVQDSGLLAGEPEHALVRFLRETPARYKAPSLYARLVASAWNAAFQQTKLPYVSWRKDPTAPIVIAGTPHDGSHVYRYVGEDWQVLHDPVRSTPATTS